MSCYAKKRRTKRAFPPPSLATGSLLRQCTGGSRRRHDRVLGFRAAVMDADKGIEPVGRSGNLMAPIWLFSA